MNPPPIDPATLPLRDIHLPDGVGWWPPAPGWWLLLLIALAAAALVWWWQRRYQARRANRAALRLLDRASAQAQAEPLAAVQTVSVALRRFVMTTQPDTRAPAVTDTAWLALLDSRWDKQAFSHGDGQLLARAPYLPADRVAPGTALALVALAREWLRAQQPAGA